MWRRVCIIMRLGYTFRSLALQHQRGAGMMLARHMSAAPLALVKELRELSGAPITDCKKALEADDVGGDLKKAFEWLRKKGAATIAKSNRSANEGLIGLAVSGSTGVLVEVNSETDFVARNADFQAFVAGLAQSTLALPLPPSKDAGAVHIDVPTLLQANGRAKAPIAQELADLVAKIRENIVIKRAVRLTVPDGIIASYLHNAVGPSMGTAAALVGLRVDPKIAQTPAARATVEHFGKRLAMHVVAARPRFLDVASIPAEVVEHERSIIRSQAAGSGKPEAIIAKMTEGRLGKFLGELTLLEQAHMIEEGNPRVKDLLEPLSQELKGSVEVAGFVRVRCGEDVEQ